MCYYLVIFILFVAKHISILKLYHVSKETDVNGILVAWGVWGMKANRSESITFGHPNPLVYLSLLLTFSVQQGDTFKLWTCCELIYIQLWDVSKDF